MQPPFSHVIKVLRKEDGLFRTKMRQYNLDPKRRFSSKRVLRVYKRNYEAIRDMCEHLIGWHEINKFEIFGGIWANSIPIISILNADPWQFRILLTIRLKNIIYFCYNIASFHYFLRFNWYFFLSKQHNKTIFRHQLLHRFLFLHVLIHRKTISTYICFISIL